MTIRGNQSIKKATLLVLLLTANTSIAADELHQKIHEALDNGAIAIGISLYLMSASNEDLCRVSISARIGSAFVELADSKARERQSGNHKLCSVIFDQSLMQRLRCHMTGVDTVESSNWDVDFGRTLINPDRLEFTASMRYHSKGISSVGVQGDCYPI